MCLTLKMMNFLSHMWHDRDGRCLCWGKRRGEGHCGSGMSQMSVLVASLEVGYCNTSAWPKERRIAMIFHKDEDTWETCFSSPLWKVRTTITTQFPFNPTVKFHDLQPKGTKMEIINQPTNQFWYYYNQSILMLLQSILILPQPINQFWYYYN